MSIFSKPEPKRKYEWPDCEPPGESRSLAANINGRHYHQVEVSPGRWQWQINEEAEKLLRDYEARQMGLFHALTTRVMTDDELREAAAYGSRLNIVSKVSYCPAEKAAELQLAWTIQQTLRSRGEPSR